MYTHMYVLYMHERIAFVVRPGTLILLQLRKMSGTSIYASIKIMNGDRDGKSAKMSATRNCLVQ